MPRTKANAIRNKEALAAKFAAGVETKKDTTASDGDDKPVDRPRRKGYTAAGVRRKDRYKIIRQIKRLASEVKAGRILPLKTTDEWIRSLAANGCNKPGMRFAPDAILALREVVIAKGTELLRDANDIACLARKSQTVKLVDVKLARHFADAHSHRYGLGV